MKTVAVVGGSGFVGCALVDTLLARGYKVRVISRTKKVHKRLIKRIDAIDWQIYKPLDLASLESALKGVDVVVNLVGILNSRIGRPDDFYQAHVVLTQNILAVCRTLHIRRYLHMSALNANVEGPSRYLRTKGGAEDLVHASKSIVTTSFQPSVIFGPGDGFINRFARLLKFAPPVFPLACADAVFAPVYLGDVVEAMAESIELEADGQRIQLCGREHYTLAEIVRFVGRLTGRRIRVVALPDAVSRLQAFVCEWVPGKPFSLDNYYSLQLDSVCTAGKTCPGLLSELGELCLRPS